MRSSLSPVVVKRNPEVRDNIKYCNDRDITINSTSCNRKGILLNCEKAPPANRFRCNDGQ